MSSRRAFTLIELLMVIVIVSVLMAVMIPQYQDYRTDAKTAVTKAKMDEIKLAITGDARLVAGGQYTRPGFETDVGSLPTALSDLVSQGNYSNYNAYSKKGWRGPYLINLTGYDTDAWGTSFSYNSSNRSLRSCGADTNCSATTDNINMSL